MTPGGSYFFLKMSSTLATSAFKPDRSPATVPEGSRALTSARVAVSLATKAGSAVANA